MPETIKINSSVTFKIKLVKEELRVKFRKATLYST